MSDLPVTVWVLLLVAALAAGWVDSVVGGGGLIQLPSLLIGLPDAGAATVSGTNKVASVAGTSAATVTYVRSLGCPWRTALPLVGASWVGSSAGASVVQLLDRRWFTPLVLVAVIGIGWYTWRRPELGLRHAPRHTGWAGWWRLGGIGLAVGLWDGAVGPGTGTVFAITLVSVMGYAFLQATVLAKLANLTTNLAAIAVLGWSGHVLWGLASTMAAASLTGGLIGSRMAVRRGNRFVRSVFLVAIVLLGAKLGCDMVRLMLG